MPNCVDVVRSMFLSSSTSWTTVAIFLVNWCFSAERMLRRRSAFENLVLVRRVTATVLVQLMSKGQEIYDKIHVAPTHRQIWLRKK